MKNAYIKKYYSKSFLYEWGIWREGWVYKLFGWKKGKEIQRNLVLLIA